MGRDQFPTRMAMANGHLGHRLTLFGEFSATPHFTAFPFIDKWTGIKDKF